MGGEWVKRRIGSLGRVVTGKTPSTADPANFGGQYPFITIPDLDGRVFISRTERTLSEKGAEALQTSLLPAGSVLMSCIATVGRCGVTTRPSFTNQQINSVVPNGDVDSLFLYYVFTQLGHELESAGGGGSVYTNVSKSRFSDIEVAVPNDIAEQRAIAHILGTLDDKIDLNRRMSETLEAMARALFQSWFVDFDPVRAKCRGTLQRAPTQWPQHILDLFPARLVDSELGEIPEGWEVQALADHFDAVKGVSYKGTGLSGSGMPLHNLNSVYEGGGYKYEGIKYYAGEYAERHVVRPGDVIVANTEQGHDRLLIGYAAIVPTFFGDRGIASHHIYRLRPKPPSPLTAAFLCYLLNSPKMHDIVSGYANGTTVNMLPIDGVQKPKIVCPPRPLVAAFDSLASKTEQRLEEMVFESRTLADLRDTLLPKLISGELRVKDAEKFIGRAV